MITRQRKFDFLDTALEKEFDVDMQKLFQQLSLECTTIVDDFKKVTNSLFKECYESQQLGKKGKIEVFHICYLLSSCLTKSYNIQMALYDSSFYLDLVQVTKTWNPNFIFQYYEREMEIYEKKAKLNILQFQYSDMEKIRLKYYEMYYGVTWEILNYLLPFIKDTEYYNKVEKTKKFCVTFSKYMVPGWKFEFEV